MDHLLYQIAITKIPLVGAITAKNLISYCGGVRQVFEASPKELRAIPGIGNKLAGNISRSAALDEAGLEMEFIQKYKIKPLFFLDPDFPQRLCHFPDCPVMLYYSGNADLNHDRIIAIVGTRRPTPYGLSVTEELISGLKEYNPLIVSGLAYGIDIAAHRRCVEEGISTIGVLGHGLSRIYPAQHQEIARQMMQAGGVLTEYTSTTTPEREHFPMRNRIIAGLCDALVVIQTARRGGSMISAEVANSYNKDVFAFPGRANDSCSEGCNYLIKSHKAMLVDSAHDVAYNMGWDQPQKASRQKELFTALTVQEQAIVEHLKMQDEAGIDQLSFLTDLSSSQMAALMLNLEFKGMIRTIPGKRYALV